MTNNITLDNGAKHAPHTFKGLGIGPKVLAILDRLEFSVPTPIQHGAIPTGMQGKDVIGVAQTGTGKTLAFGIPMVQRLHENGGRGLVVVPTRELALQVEEALRTIGRPMGLSAVVLIGGAPIGRQKAALRGEPQIIVATPGRLIDHLQTGSVSLSQVKILVLDEADRMLDMGFAPQIARIVRAVPKDRQTMLFSATMPAEIVELATSYMQLPVRVEVAVPGSTADEITQELFVVKKEDKASLLEKLLYDYRGPVLIFSRTKHGARKILRDVLSMGHTGAELHSNRSLNQRRDALDGFKSGQYRVLVATDIAARGIDVEGIELVLNYDIPDQAEDYVHRVGRTGRAGRTGHAISFATPDQASEVRSIEKLIRTALPIAEDSEHALEPPVPRSKRLAAAGRPAGGRSPGRSGSPRNDSPRPRPEGSRRFDGSQTNRPRASETGSPFRPAGPSRPRDQNGTGAGRPPRTGDRREGGRNFSRGDRVSLTSE